MPETMYNVCRWRLMAEEVRTTSEGFSMTSAKQTMEHVACVWDRMADDLEERLSKRSERAWPERGS